MTTYAVNLTNNATTVYENFSFNSMCLGHDGNYYALGPAGLYSLGGDLDDTANIDSMLGLGKQDFGVPNIKHLSVAYIGVRAETPVLLRLGCNGESAEYLARGSSTELVQERIDLGKGWRANWFTVDLYNTSGGQFTVDSLEVVPHIISKRRVR